jgi:hypothetical protein
MLDKSVLIPPMDSLRIIGFAAIEDYCVGNPYAFMLRLAERCFGSISILLKFPLDWSKVAG